MSRYSPSIASGPFRWRLLPEESDRLRFLLHRSVMAPGNSLRVRGGPTLSLWLRQLIGDYGRPLTAESLSDIRISVGGFDEYWMRVFFRGDFYEPELYRLFSRIRRLRSYDLIDGGANIGFWSAVLTSSRFGIDRAVALEPSPSTYLHLARTASLCDGRFIADPRALSAQPGMVEFEQGLAPEIRHISLPGVNSSTPGERVLIEATTVDQLVAKHNLNTHDLIVKLDVEGAEFDCIRGAANAFSHGAVFIYEEHGKERRSLLTARLLDFGALCWFIDDDGLLIPIKDSAAATGFKTAPGRGYNFLCSSRAYAQKYPLEQRLFEGDVPGGFRTI